MEVQFNHSNQLEIELACNSIAIICGKGLVLDKARTKQEMTDLYNFYSNICNYLNGNGFRRIIFTGGYTNPIFPTDSESKTAKNYFISRFGKGWEYGIIIEETSRNLFGNLFYGVKKFFDEFYYTLAGRDNYEITFFIDGRRMTTIRLFAFLLFRLTRLKYKIVCIGELT